MSRSQSNPAPRFVRLLGVQLDNLSHEETLDHLFTDLAQGRGGWAVTPNLDILRRLVRDPAYRELTAPATLKLADGMPLVWASRLQGTPLKARVSGSDLIWSVTARAAKEHRSVFFLGGNPGAGAAAVAKLRQMHPDLIVAGIESPPLGFEKDPVYVAALIQRLQAAAPDVCLVALSTPKQDYLIRDLMPHLPRTWFLGIGISFSFVAGDVKRAPVWMRRTGLEWLHRLLQEPRRLARRYLLDGVPFALGLMVKALLGRFTAPGRGRRSAGNHPAQPPEKEELATSAAPATRGG